jgi:hypothetical protein
VANTARPTIASKKLATPKTGRRCRRSPGRHDSLSLSRSIILTNRKTDTDQCGNS